MSIFLRINKGDCLPPGVGAGGGGDEAQVHGSDIPCQSVQPQKTGGSGATPMGLSSETSQHFTTWPEAL